MSAKRRVVVTGMGAITALGNTLEQSWEQLIQGHSGIGPITRFPCQDLPCRVAAEVHDFQLEQSVPDGHFNELLNRGAQFTVAAAHMASQDAGAALFSQMEQQRIGIALGSSGSQADLDVFSGRNRERSAVLAVNYHTVSSVLAARYQAQGPNSCITTACASGTQAIGLAMRTIQYDRADVMLAGGGDTMVSPLNLIGFCLLGAVSTIFQDEPTRSCRPFDRDRAGMVLGEGAGIVVLEEYEHALARGAHIYAEMRGFGNSISGYRLTDSPPNGAGPDLAMRAALADAQLEPEVVDYINAHGTATRDNDRCETSAIKTVFGDYAYHLPISSTKAALGHVIAGAGALELIIAIQAIQHNIIPPTLNLEHPDPRCDLDYTPNQARSATVRVVLSNSFGFGGSNASLVACQI